MTKTLEYVNKPHNNSYYEWGLNCATLGFDKAKAQKAFVDFMGGSPEDSDQFWMGFNEGPRETNEIYAISTGE